MEPRAVSESRSTLVRWIGIADADNARLRRAAGVAEPDEILRHRTVD